MALAKRRIRSAGTGLDSGARPGTGTRRAGRATAARVLEAARAVLVERGYPGFTMRNVAAHAGLHLANVQYYFPTREHLIRALLDATGAHYRNAYAELTASLPSDPRQRFLAVLDYNLRDVTTAPTRRYFTQLWALLDACDATGGLLAELYELDLQQLSEQISALCPTVAAPEIRRRAALLASMIEGMLLVHGAHGTGPAARHRLLAGARELGLAIALGLAGTVP